MENQNETAQTTFRGPRFTLVQVLKSLFENNQLETIKIADLCGYSKIRNDDKPKYVSRQLDKLHVHRVLEYIHQ